MRGLTDEELWDIYDKAAVENQHLGIRSEINAALRAVADAAVAADRAGRGEPVAYGMLNTSITGREKPLMMVRIDIPADDQYQGKLWVPLYLGTKDSIEENQQ